MRVDLHCHTLASDGSLSPSALLNFACEQEIDILSITDHDTLAAYNDLPLTDLGKLKLIPGIEFSTQWRKINLHIVGLNFSLDHPSITEGILSQTKARQKRAEKIADKLTKYGFKDCLSGASDIAGHDHIGRPHFAQHLINIGAVSDMAMAFKKYLGAGKVGDVKQYWAPYPEIINWIRDAGGTAVIAHPAKYNLTHTKLAELTDDFIAAGGQAIEVVSGKQDPTISKSLATLCERKNLLASCGSDFHHPDQSWAVLGHCSKLPEICKPVWEHW